MDLYVLGGYNGTKFDAEECRQMFKFDSHSKVWEPWGLMPVPRFHHVAVAHGEYLYLIGNYHKALQTKVTYMKELTLLHWVQCYVPFFSGLRWRLNQLRGFSDGYGRHQPGSLAQLDPLLLPSSQPSLDSATQHADASRPSRRSGWFWLYIRLWRRQWRANVLPP